MKPKFEHDCNRCSFLGHFFSHDVYTCDQMVGGKTIVARASSTGPDYASCPSIVMAAKLEPGQMIRTGGRDIPYMEYLFSPDSSDYERAMVVGLAHSALMNA